MPVFAHPTDLTGRIADNQSVWRNIFSDHGPAPIIAYSPIVWPQTIVAFAPIEAPLPTCVFKYWSLRETALRGLTTFVKTQLGPKKTSSPQVTPV